MKKEELIERGEKAFLHTYNRYPIVLDRGEGVYLYDSEGKRYLDFASGIGVFALGYGNEAYNRALEAQIGKLIHASNYYYTEPAVLAAEALLKASDMDRVFFTNSGAEAVEGALKAARKYAYTRDGHAGHEIIAMEHSFHGRTMGALSVTGKQAYREPFEPLVGNIKYATIGDFEDVSRKVSENTCAIILEPVQGEGGIYPQDASFLKALRALCDEKDILLIFDEIQCGMGRSGSYFAFQHYGVTPDILTTAKALGCGIPVGAFLLTEKTAEKSLAAGDHGSTYGGNPLIGAAVLEVFRQFEERGLLAHVRELTPYLEKTLDSLVAEFPFLKERRGLGFMQGIESEKPVAAVIAKCQEKGMLLINAGTNVLRFLPPLIVEKAHIDEMAQILREALQAAEA
ncbi:MAG: aspartate aminotransferase family protein [Lachnospiraceae bacterium]|nr:aspartate aminotransferase family protein [Lachnospiraceae bacterium]